MLGKFIEDIAHTAAMHIKYVQIDTMAKNRSREIAACQRRTAQKRNVTPRIFMVPTVPQNGDLPASQLPVSLTTARDTSSEPARTSPTAPVRLRCTQIEHKNAH